MPQQRNPRLWIATRKGLFAADRDGRGWKLGEPSFLGDPVTMVLPDARDGAVYAALRLGHFGVKLHRSADGGATWQEIAAPAYPPKPEAPAGAEPDKTPWSTDLIWSLAAGAPSQPGRLWAGTIPGGLFRSDDAGAHWSLVESLWQRPERAQWFGGGYDHAGIHSICVDPRDPRRLALAVSCGGVWRSDDEGASWTLLGEGLRADYMPPEGQDDLAVQDPHLMVQCAAAPDTLWIQHHNGVFVSRDAGRQWSAVKGIQPSDFGFAVAVHPQDPLTAWFAPAVKDERRVPVDARLVVTRTRDGGRSFQAFGQGLPQPSWDLVYRHGLVVDDTGMLLAMASTTGGLWTSDDGGEQWQEVSSHLPPVYALRFG
jgi:hypothetical protein